MTSRRAAAVLTAIVAISAVAVIALDRGEDPAPESPAPAAPTLAVPVERPSFSPPIRVNLVGDPAESLELKVDGPVRIVVLGGERELFSGKELEATVRAAPTGLRIESRSPSRRHGVGLEIRVIPATRVELIPERSPAIWIDDHEYRGRLRLLRRRGNRLIAVNVLPLEDYVASVVDGEMPIAFGDEARKAQAVVARTYALDQAHRHGRARDFDVYASVRSQKYLGTRYRDANGRLLAGESENARRIVAATAGVVCTHRGELFTTYYSAVCGGETLPGTAVFEDAAAPLRPVECDWCRAADRYRWTNRLSRAEASRRLLGRPNALRELVRVRTGDDGGLPVFDGHGPGGPRRFTAVELRRRLPAQTLHSFRFDVRPDGDDLVFEGRGHGHGVGLCQWGARGQAAAGRTFRDVLRHYYPGSTLVTLR